MKRTAYFFILTLAIACQSNQKRDKVIQVANMWVTQGDRSKLLQPTALSGVDKASNEEVISLDTAQRYQTIDGFGFALTGGSAQLIQKLPTPSRDSLLRELFLNDNNGIGINYLRVSMGASDLDDHVFSYDDIPAGSTDKNLDSFSLAEDEKFLIPTLKEILLLQPNIKIMGTPWSAPTWMKDNHSPKGGKLNPVYYQVYADYFVKYIRGMASHGITIDAITLQNEPEHPGNLPSMTMTAPEQAEFVKSFLGPTFQANNIRTKIIVYDHNCDHPEYPLAVLADSVARKFIDGAAFHLYLGEIGAMQKVHDANPDKNVYFTEQWTSGKGDFGGDLTWHVKNLIIGASRNWSRTVLEWNLAADEKLGPHTDDGGCTLCQGAITVNRATLQVTRNVSYYIIAHASKFVPTGSVRIFSSEVNGLPNVGFITPEGKKILIVLNEGTTEWKFSVSAQPKFVDVVLPPQSVGTIVF